MYRLSCLSVANFQLIASWLISWDVMFTTRIDNYGYINTVFAHIPKTQISVLEGCGATFSLFELSGNKLITAVSAGVLVTPAHVER